MKRRTLLLAGGAAAASFVVSGVQARRFEGRDAVRSLRGVRARRVLGPDEVAELPQPLGRDFDVDGTKAVLHAGDRLVMIDTGPGGPDASQLGLSGAAVDSVAIDRGGLLGVRGRFLGQLRPSGSAELVESIPLPTPGMRIAGSAVEGRPCLFGGGVDVAASVYRLCEAGDLGIVARLPAPAVSIADSASALYAATAREVYRLTEEAAALVFHAPEGFGAIASIAAEPDDRILYVATAACVHAVRGFAARLVLPETGGELRLRGGALVVWNPDARQMIRVEGLPRALLE